MAEIEDNQTKQSKTKNILIISGIVLFVLLLIGAYFLHKHHLNKEASLEEENIRSEERIKIKQAENDKLKLNLDSLKTDISTLSAVIDYQKNNPQIIREKYVEIRNNVVSYTVDDKIKYLSNRLSKKGNNR